MRIRSARSSIAAAGVQRRQSRREALAVAHRARVQSQDLAAGAAGLLPVEAAARLRPDPPPADHVGHERRQGESATLLGVVETLGEVGRDVREDVETRDVERAERRGAGPADGRTRDGVDFLDGVVARRKLLQDAQDAVHPDAVADEAGRVLGDDHSLAQHVVAEAHHGVDDRRVGATRRYHLEQRQMARWVEEVGPEPVPAERFPAPLAEAAERDARCVRAHDRVRRPVRLDSREQVPLDVQPFDDRLDDPVAGSEAREVGVEAAGGDEPRRLRCEERVGFQASRAVETGAGGLRVEIEQEGRNAGVGDVGGDLRAHHAGPQHPYRPNLLHGVQVTPRAAGRTSLEDTSTAGSGSSERRAAAAYPRPARPLKLHRAGGAGASSRARWKLGWRENRTAQTPREASRACSWPEPLPASPDRRRALAGSTPWPSRSRRG